MNQQNNPTPSVPDSAALADNLLMNATFAVVFGGVLHVKPGFREALIEAFEFFGRAQYERGLKDYEKKIVDKQDLSFRLGIEKAAEVVEDHWDQPEGLTELLEKLRALLPKEGAKPGGFIPIIVLLIFGAAAFAVIGAKLEQRRINQTMICHEPGKEPEPWCRNCRQRTEYPEAPMRWPSMSVPDYDGGGR